MLFYKRESSYSYSTFFRLEHPESAEEEETIEKTQMNLDAYAKQGLRVLVMAKRILSEEEYLEWLTKHREAEVLGINLTLAEVGQLSGRVIAY